MVGFRSCIVGFIRSARLVDLNGWLIWSTVIPAWITEEIPSRIWVSGQWCDTEENIWTQHLLWSIGGLIKIHDLVHPEPKINTVNLFVIPVSAILLCYRSKDRYTVVLYSKEKPLLCGVHHFPSSPHIPYPTYELIRRIQLLTHLCCLHHS